ncbi:MAG: hypothetical protein ACE5GV_17475 [Candidatus Scalindua sp.]
MLLYLPPVFDVAGDELERNYWLRQPARKTCRAGKPESALIDTGLNLM